MSQNNKKYKYWSDYVIDTGPLRTELLAGQPHSRGLAWVVKGLVCEPRCEGPGFDSGGNHPF